MTGEKCLQLAAKHLGERYVLGAFAPKNNAGWTGPWDCAEYCSWVIFQVGGILYGVDDHQRPDRADAYTGYFLNDGNNLGVEISVAEASRTPGALLVRRAVPGLIGHVVFSDGKGGTYEARGAAYGVVQGVLAGRRWDQGLLVPGFYYESGPAVPVVAPPKGTVYRVGGPGMRAAKVKQIQQALLAGSPPFHPGPVDGIYGVQTAAAVQAFQIANGLVPDGEVGELTAKALGVKLP